ncbi:MAG: methyltransferase domain-containing protein [Pseudomonadota bacterium]
MAVSDVGAAAAGAPGVQPQVYDTAFFDGQRDGSIASADLIVPLVLRHFSPRRVVDVGCGVGGWLAAFQRNGVSEVQGFDGDYVDRGMLEIPADRFTPADLSNAPALGQFDLACTLEVAEHLPETSADHFVDRLTEAAPVVLFSAAVPGQDGSSHINEQWPSYWAEKFARRGFVTLDIIRPEIWTDEHIQPWYRQNILVFCKPDHVPQGMTPVPQHGRLDMAHPAWRPKATKGRRVPQPVAIRDSVAMIRHCVSTIARTALRRLVKG